MCLGADLDGALDLDADLGVLDFELEREDVFALDACLAFGPGLEAVLGLDTDGLDVLPLGTAFDDDLAFDTAFGFEPALEGVLVLVLELRLGFEDVLADVLGVVLRWDGFFAPTFD